MGEGQGYCFRCEHRVRSLESKGEHSPRWECGNHNSNYIGCYMYRPVLPVVQSRDLEDERPLFAPWIISARSSFVRVADEDELILTAVPTEDGVFQIYTVPGSLDDKPRLEWLEERDGYALVSDDNGHWAVVVEGFQNCLIGPQPADVTTSFWIEKDQWYNSIREAIDAAMLDEKYGYWGKKCTFTGDDWPHMIWIGPMTHKEMMEKFPEFKHNLREEKEEDG